MTLRPRDAAAKGGEADLPDVNVWLALAVREHPHNAAAQAYWTQGAATRVCFSRVTMLGLVRLLAQPRLMGDAALGPAAALALYEGFVALPEIGLMAEPASTGAVLRRYMEPRLPARMITDAYLAAFAVAGGLRLVSFDRDFARFDGLEMLQLAPDAPGA